MRVGSIWAQQHLFAVELHEGLVAGLLRFISYVAFQLLEWDSERYTGYISDQNWAPDTALSFVGALGGGVTFLHTVAVQGESVQQSQQ